MPIYEYACDVCSSRASVYYPTFTAAESGQPHCPRCDSANLTRPVSRVAFHRQRDLLARLSEPHPRALGVDDPCWLGQAARVAGQAMDKDLGRDWEETVRRLEAGDASGTVEIAPPGGFAEPGPDALPDGES